MGNGMRAIILGGLVKLAIGVVGATLLVLYVRFWRPGKTDEELARLRRLPGGPMAMPLLAVGLAIQAVYRQFRRPGKDPELWCEWRVPGAKWIIVGILAFVFVFLAIVMSKDPLE